MLIKAIAEAQIPCIYFFVYWRVWGIQISLSVVSLKFPPLLVIGKFQVKNAS